MLPGVVDDPFCQVADTDATARVEARMCGAAFQSAGLPLEVGTGTLVDRFGLHFLRELRQLGDGNDMDLRWVWPRHVERGVAGVARRFGSIERHENSC